MSNLTLTAEQTKMFVELFTAATRSFHRADATPIVKLLRHVHPNLNPLIVLEGWNLIKTGQFVEARALLDEADQATPGVPSIKAAIAATLFFASEPLWQNYAAEVKALAPDEDALAIVSALESCAQSGVPPLAAGHLFGVLNGYNLKSESHTEAPVAA